MENLLSDSKMRKSRSKKWQVLSVLHILLIISLSFSTLVKAEVVQSTHNIRVSGTIGSTVEETNKHQTLVADLSAITQKNLPETGTVVNQRIVFLGYLLIGISGGVVLFCRKKKYPIEYFK